MNFTASAGLVLEHTGAAVAMALMFGAGAVTALPILRRRVDFLLVVPRWFARTLARVLAAEPPMPSLALLIFAFNGSAILVYMLTGLIPLVPAVVAFATGLNVVAAALLGKETLTPPKTQRHLPFPAALCGGLTFLLELPCFWYAMAMGWTLKPNIAELMRGADAAPIRNRVVAYVMIILPMLAVSAVAEAYAVTEARK